MQHDLQLRADARLIYDESRQWKGMLSFDDAEEQRTAPYLDAVETAIAMQRLERSYATESRQMALL